VEHAQHDGRAQQCRGRIDQAGHPHERPRQLRITDGRGLKPAHVRVRYTPPRRARTRDLGQGQVGAQRELPRHIDRARDRAQHAAAARQHTGPNVVAQRERLQRRDGHALPVDRVEAADCVAEHEEAVRESPQALVAAPDVRREAEPDGVVERLCGCDRLAKIGELQRACEVVEAGWVLGRVVAEHPE
jgi:hypothetical protein